MVLSEFFFTLSGALSADPEPAVEQTGREEQGEEQRLCVPPLSVLPLQAGQSSAHLQDLKGTTRRPGQTEDRRTSNHTSCVSI